MNKRDVFLINSKVLAQLQPHMRINTSSDLFRVHSVQQWIPSWVTRWWLAQSRQRDIVRVHKMFEENLSDDMDDQITSAVNSAIVGLKNLKLTYAEDTTAVAQIDVIIEMIQRHLPADILTSEAP